MNLLAKEKRDPIKENLTYKDKCYGKVYLIEAKRDKIIICILCISQKIYKRNPVVD